MGIHYFDSESQAWFDGQVVSENTDGSYEVRVDQLGSRKVEKGEVLTHLRRGYKFSVGDLIQFANPPWVDGSVLRRFPDGSYEVKFKNQPVPFVVPYEEVSIRL